MTPGAAGFSRAFTFSAQRLAEPVLTFQQYLFVLSGSATDGPPMHAEIFLVQRCSNVRPALY